MSRLVAQHAGVSAISCIRPNCSGHARHTVRPILSSKRTLCCQAVHGHVHSCRAFLQQARKLLIPALWRHSSKTLSLLVLIFFCAARSYMSCSYMPMTSPCSRLGDLHRQRLRKLCPSRLASCNTHRLHFSCMQVPSDHAQSAPGVSGPGCHALILLECAPDCSLCVRQ